MIRQILLFLLVFGLKRENTKRAGSFRIFISGSSVFIARKDPSMLRLWSNYRACSTSLWFFTSRQIHLTDRKMDLCKSKVWAKSRKAWFALTPAHFCLIQPAIAFLKTFSVEATGTPLEVLQSSNQVAATSKKQTVQILIAKSESGFVFWQGWWDEKEIQNRGLAVWF